MESEGISVHFLCVLLKMEHGALEDCFDIERRSYRGKLSAKRVTIQKYNFIACQTSSSCEDSWTRRFVQLSPSVAYLIGKKLLFATTL